MASREKEALISSNRFVEENGLPLQKYRPFLMARFDVYRLVEGGLVVDLQADLLSDLATRVVAPLLPLDGSLKPASNLNPIFDVDVDGYGDGEKYMLGIQFLAAIPNCKLQNYICSLSTEEQIMLKSIDMLF